jgi:hypothetical protein
MKSGEKENIEVVAGLIILIVSLFLMGLCVFKIIENLKN